MQSGRHMQSTGAQQDRKHEVQLGRSERGSAPCATWQGQQHDLQPASPVPRNTAAGPHAGHSRPPTFRAPPQPSTVRQAGQGHPNGPKGNAYAGAAPSQQRARRAPAAPPRCWPRGAAARRQSRGTAAARVAAPAPRPCAAPCMQRTGPAAAPAGAGTRREHYESRIGPAARSQMVRGQAPHAAAAH